MINFKQGALTYSCVAKNGGSNQIERTTEKVRKPDLCLDNSECAENAECSYDSLDLRYECQCKIKRLNLQFREIDFTKNFMKLISRKNLSKLYR